MATISRFKPSELFGILPPMVTPFDKDEEIDEPAFRMQVKFMLDHKVHGVVVGGSAGEGFTLSTDELRRIVAIAAEEVNGRVPLVAGIIVDSTRQAIRRAKAVADFGVTALQVTPVHYIYKPDDQSTLDHFRAVADEVGIPILIYNVIPWNYASPDLLLGIMREVPLVVGVKQSAGDLKTLADLLIYAQPTDRIFAAIDALLYPSFALGAHGVISQILAAIPGPCVELWNLVQSGDHIRALELHKRMLRLWNAIYSQNRVAVTKHVLSLQGCPTGYPRRPMAPASDAQRSAVRQPLADLVGDWVLQQCAG